MRHTGQDGQDGQVGQDRRVEHGGCDAGETEVFDQVLRCFKRHVAQMDMIAAFLGEQAGDQ